MTFSEPTISNRVSIKYLSSLDNLIFLDPEYNLQVLEQEVTTVQKEYEKAQKEWLESNETLKPKRESIREQKLAHLENVKKILEIITQF